MAVALRLVSAALECIQLWINRFASVQIRPCTALRTEQVACEPVHFTLHIGTLSACEVLLHRIKQLSADDCFMRVLENQSLFGRILQSFLQLIALGIGLEIDRISAIKLVGKHLANRRDRPTIGLVKVRISRPIACCSERIHARTQDFLTLEGRTDSADADATCVHFKDSLNDRCGFGIGYKLFRVIGVLHIAVGNCRSHTFPTFALCTLNSTDFLARISGKEVIEEVTHSRHFVNTVDAVYTVRHSNEPHIIGWSSITP